MITTPPIISVFEAGFADHALNELGEGSSFPVILLKVDPMSKCNSATLVP